MTRRTTPSSDGVLAEVFWGFPRYMPNTRRSVHSPPDHFIISLIISKRRDWRDIRSKWPWLGTRTGTGGTATLTIFFFTAAHGSMDNMSTEILAIPTNYWPHLHFSADRIERSFDQFKANVFSTRRVLQELLDFYINVFIISPQKSILYQIKSLYLKIKLRTQILFVL